MFIRCGPPENNIRINSAINLTVLANETQFSITSKGNEALLMLVQEKVAFHV
jgi:hypothetical protein